jgi:arsenate reductase
VRLKSIFAILPAHFIWHSISRRLMNYLYGIPNCDTVKKARSWLEDAGVDFVFHDFRKDGLEEKMVEQWLESVGTATLVNKRSTTWKQLSDEQKEQALSSDAASLLVQHPTLIKRPVLVTEKLMKVGFKAEQYSELF